LLSTLSPHPHLTGTNSDYLPPISGVVVFDARFHVLQLVEDGKHVYEFPKRQQIRLGDEILPFLLMTQASNFSTELFARLFLEEKTKTWTCLKSIRSEDRSRPLLTKITNLKVHEVQQFLDLRTQNLDGFFVDLNTVRLFVRLRLRNRSRAASPGVKHDCMAVAFHQKVILNGIIQQRRI
jgi:hypothetical protein